MRWLFLSLFLCGVSYGQLKIWVSYNDEEFAVFKEIVKDFEQKTGIKVDVQRIPFEGQEQKILTACATRSTPDIARIDCAFLGKLALKNAIEEIDIGELKDKLLPAAVKSAMIGEKLFGVPDQITFILLFYNKKLFKEAGLDPEKPPKTWDEFVEYAKKLTNPEKGIYGFAMRNTLWWTLPFFYCWGAEFIKDKKCVLNSEEAVKALQFKVDLYQKYKVEPGAWKAGAVDPDMGFQNEKYAMVLNGPWKIKSLKEMGIDFGIAKIPEGPAGSYTAIGGTYMVIFRGTKHKKEAEEFLKYLVSKEVQIKWANELGQVPVNLESFSGLDMKKHPYFSVLIEQMKTARARPILEDYSQIENIANPLMEAALMGQKSVKEALDEITKRINEILEGE